MTCTDPESKLKRLKFYLAAQPGLDEAGGCRGSTGARGGRRLDKKTNIKKVKGKKVQEEVMN